MTTSNISSWVVKPCSDGISIDVRPPKRYQLDLNSLSSMTIPDFRTEIASNSIAILYSQDNIKLTLYQSGRMLVETRDIPVAEKIVEGVLEFFQI